MNDRLLKRMILEAIQETLYEGERDEDEIEIGNNEDLTIINALKLQKIELNKIHRTMKNKDIGSRDSHNQLLDIVDNLDALISSLVEGDNDISPAEFHGFNPADIKGGLKPKKMISKKRKQPTVPSFRKETRGKLPPL